LPHFGGNVPSPAVPAFPFNSTRNGVLFTIVIAGTFTLLSGLAVAYVTARLNRRNAAIQADAVQREQVSAQLRTAVMRIEQALDNMTASRREEVRSACDGLRDVANIQVGGPGTERLQERMTEFVFGVERLEQQRGPIAPQDETARSLFNDMNSAIYAFARGWRVPHRLRTRPGILGFHRRRAAGVPRADRRVPTSVEEQG
jgi:hypothetical protein